MRLAGDRLAGDHYEPIAIAELPDGSLDSYSEVLDLNLRWEQGQLLWYDPETDTAIMSLAEMQRIAEEEQQARQEAERIAAERIRELEEPLRRHKAWHTRIFNPCRSRVRVCTSVARRSRTRSVQAGKSLACMQPDTIHISGRTRAIVGRSR